ncbi:MAG: hypothetical protein JXQ71_03375 [Verrucomicrobia bacterium]|nr:hypothetical protein [Verrucomicrobiota bacterium]
MTTWTDTARQRLDRYFEQIRDTLRTSGADPDEVSEDLRRHIHEEVAARQLAVVTEDDVRRILARIGAPEPLGPFPSGASAPPAVAAGSEAALGRWSKGAWSVVWGVFSVVLPLVTLGVEMATHMCAGVFFDPIPSPALLLMVAAVPAANAWGWWAVRQGRTRGLSAVMGANGFAAGIAAFYALAYLPILPFAVVGLWYFGWGLLPMAPLFALLGALMLRRPLRRLRGAAGPAPSWGLGLGLAVLALALTVLPATLTRHWAGRVATGSAAQGSRALSWLRRVGQTRVLLADCYGATRWMRESPIDLHLFGKPVSPEQARSVFFRVTGKPFNAFPPPQLAFTRGGWKLLDDMTWDREQGGDAVGSRVKGLTLAASRLDALVESEAALGYVEWVMEFKNTSARPREARAQIALPPGGVVSRLTLWVNGEEREAAFAGRSDVRQAYQEVAIRRRRDPVLVTSCGPDRVLMQCFPVPAGGGFIKVRIGITAPLILKSLADGVLPWPYFTERNFSLADDFAHALWAESKAALESRRDELKPDPAPSARHALRGHLADRFLGNPASALRIRRPAEGADVWTAETLHGGVIRQSLVETPASRPERLVVVLDGSRSMEHHFPAVADALRRWPEDLEVTVLVAADRVRALLESPGPLSAPRRDSLADQVGHLKGVGGQDNIPALAQALELATGTAQGVVLWIHGSQPVLLDSPDRLAQVFLWRGSQTRLLDFQTWPGPNRIAEHLEEYPAVRPVPRLGTVADDLAGLFPADRAQPSRIEAVRRKTAATGAAPSEPQASKHLARLWAFEEVRRLTAERSRDAALQLAAHYQLVTPVSGAVVLETRRQFEQAGLQPAGADTVPSVPEPALLWGLAAGALLVARRLFRKRENES